EVKTMVISQFEKKYLTRTLREAGGNVTLAAKKAGKERRAFGKLLKKHGITKDE
ncbi:MAG TPA: sigma-54-dependent Fis family transcriptional regulator, partial [Thermoplasmatales archaeon]|nr:sigma-54-dependent Fis family transcriptional regulator [Thermoplasmatales archaeon]